MGKNICEPFYMTNLVDWRVRSAIALGLNMFENTNKSGFCANVHIFLSSSTILVKHQLGHQRKKQS